jgi:hypothetical protein
MFLVLLLGWPERTWPETDNESQSDDGKSLDGDLVTTDYCVVESLFDHELELFTAEINLFVQMALEFVGRDDYVEFNICAYIIEIILLVYV